MKPNDTFNYTYSAKQQDEIKAIRSKYAPPAEAEDKLTRLRRLDAGVTQKATAFALAFGIAGVLVMGSGMSLIMTDLYLAHGLGSTAALVLGCAIGITGMGLVCAAYPLYNRIVTLQRKKLAPEIIRLTDELME